MSLQVGGAETQGIMTVGLTALEKLIETWLWCSHAGTMEETLSKGRMTSATTSVWEQVAPLALVANARYLSFFLDVPWCFLNYFPGAGTQRE